MWLKTETLKGYGKSLTRQEVMEKNDCTPSLFEDADFILYGWSGTDEELSFDWSQNNSHGNLFYWTQTVSCDYGDIVIEIERCCPECEKTSCFDAMTGMCSECNVKTDYAYNE